MARRYGQGYGGTVPDVTPAAGPTPPRAPETPAEVDAGSVEDAVAAFERRAQEVDLLRRRVLNVIPHALRTPITTLRGLAEALPDASEADIRGAIAPALQRLAAQAEHLLDDMLLAAGITSTLPTGAPVAASAADTARAVWGELAPGRPPLDVDGEDVLVVAPVGSLFKMFVHVLDNAVKYGTGSPVLRLSRSGDRATLRLESPGEPVAEVEMLGEPFFRGERAVMLAPGLGVGLAVTRALAEHAGGTFHVGPLARGGLVTTVELGCAQASDG